MDDTILTRDSAGQAQLFDLTPAFDPAIQIYNIYPKKVGKPHALRAIRRALRQFGFAHIENKTKAYRVATSIIDPQFIPHPSTWFNQERFNDDPQTWTNSFNQRKTDFPQIQRLDRQIERTLRDAQSIYTQFAP